VRRTRASEPRPEAASSFTVLHFVCKTSYTRVRTHHDMMEIFTLAHRRLLAAMRDLTPRASRISSTCAQEDSRR
jgi:hypothetical protein